MNDTTDSWQAWIREIDAGLLVLGVRQADSTWVVAADAPRHVTEYLELDTERTGHLIDPTRIRTISALRRTGEVVGDYADGMPGDVLLAFSVPTPIPADPPVETVHVDLKWSLWTTERETWDEYAPGCWERMAAAFDGEAGPITILTAPRKEIRYGRVTIGRGEAHVELRCGWDDIGALMAMHDLDPERDEHRDAVTSYFEGGDGFDPDGDTVGAIVQEVVSALTFRALVAAIDAMEELLLRVERENGEHFAAFCRELAAHPGGEPADTAQEAPR